MLGLPRPFDRVVEPAAFAFVALRPLDRIAREQAEGPSRAQRAVDHARNDFLEALSLGMESIHIFVLHKYCTLQVNVEFHAQASGLLPYLLGTVKAPLFARLHESVTSVERAKPRLGTIVLTPTAL